MDKVLSLAASMPQFLTSIVFPRLLGITAHLGLFIRGEWHLRAPAILIAHTITFLVIFYLKLQHREYGIHHSLYRTFVLTSAYLSGLFASMSVYRLFFHHLEAFPGPRLAVLSKLWHVWKCRGSKGHLVLEDWHNKYGDIVRTGVRMSEIVQQSKN
jgi:hypothetical protein